MENTLNYKFNYALPPIVAATPKVDPDAPIFAAEEGMVASLSSQECIFQLKRTGESHVMTFQVLQSMDQCREFRTLDEHAARLQSTIPALANKRDDVMRVLENLVQRRLLVSGDSFIEQLRAAPRVQAPLRAVFIRACDRPEQLAHLLASLTEYERRFRVDRRYVLLDDSVLQANVNEQRDLLREFARTTGCKVNYIGRAERTKILEKFGKALPQAKSAATALFSREAQTRGLGFGGGRSKNLALLLSAGSRMVLLDDDLRLPLRRLESARPGLNPSPNGHTRVHFHANVEESLSAGAEIAQDPFELNLAVCGQTLGSLSDYSLDRAALRGLNLSRIDIIRGETCIIATQLGSYGSSRTASGLWLYQLDPESRKEFWKDRAQYMRNMEVQHIWHGVNQARVIELSGFTPFAMDNSRLLPCTNSVGRGEDSLHGALMRYCHPSALTMWLPEAVGHVQESARKRSETTMSTRVPVVNIFLRDYVARQFGLFKAEDPAQRMRFMAEVLRDLAGASAAERVGHLREYLSYIRADTIDRLQHQMESVEGAPVYWQADARAIVEVNAKALLSNAPPRLGDWPADLDEAGCAETLVTELNGMATSLEHWPALWQHAAEQGEKLLSAL